MLSFRVKAGLPVAVLLAFISCLPVVQGFSDGRIFARGSAATRKVYCNRPVSKRGPLHFSPECDGYCEPRRDFDRYYTLNISTTTYWLDVVMVNITANPDYEKSVTGFSIYAIDEAGHVAGSFVEDDKDVIVGTCNDIITITDETHAAFHVHADHDRKEISIQWQPDGYNHGNVKFILWVVNNHSDVYYTESQWLSSQRNGSNVLDVVSSLKKVLSAVNIELFENAFKYRSAKGYQLDLPNPFSAFLHSPKVQELIPANSPRSNTVSNSASATPAGSGSKTAQGGTASGSKTAQNGTASGSNSGFASLSNESSTALGKNANGAGSNSNGSWKTDNSGVSGNSSEDKDNGNKTTISSNGITNPDTTTMISPNSWGAVTTSETTTSVSNDDGVQKSADLKSTATATAAPGSTTSYSPAADNSAVRRTAYTETTEYATPVTATGSSTSADAISSTRSAASSSASSPAAVGTSAGSV